MNRVKELREEKEWRQSDLAGMLGVRQQAVSKYENGSVDLDTDTIRRLCEIFGVTADYLLCFSAQRAARLPEEDAELLAAYHAAPDSIRQGITALLEPYKQETSAEAV